MKDAISKEERWERAVETARLIVQAHQVPGGESIFAALGADSDVINGQLVTVRNRDVYAPVGWAPVVQHTPSITPTIPPSIGNLPQSGGGSSYADAAAIQSPWSLFHSPLPWGIGMLIIGILGLRIIHWRPRG